MSNGWLDELTAQLKDDPDYVAQYLAMQLMEQANRLLLEQGLSRSDLATKMGVDRARVTRMFNAPPNLTLRSLAQLANALGTAIHVELVAPESEVQCEPVSRTVESSDQRSAGDPLERQVAPSSVA